MQTASLAGGFADAPVDAARAFRVAMNAMARPGTIHQVAGANPPAPLSAAAATLLLTLCDTETSIALAGDRDNEHVRDWLTFHTGAPIVDVGGDVMFAIGRWADLTPLGRYAMGTPEYPDRSATLIVEVDALEAPGARLTGPGIAEAAFLSLPELDAFAANHRHYPLGLDFYFTCGDRLAALPRTTRVEAQ